MSNELHIHIFRFGKSLVVTQMLHISCSPCTSDQDPAYQTPSVVKWMQDNQIDYRTTHKNNHNILGILNRFVRTLRDLNGNNRLEDNIQALISEYNQTVHSSLTINGQRHSPNQMTANDEKLRTS